MHSTHGPAWTIPIPCDRVFFMIARITRGHWERELLPPQASITLSAAISARSRLAELLILCARIGFNP